VTARCEIVRIHLDRRCQRRDCRQAWDRGQICAGRVGLVRHRHFLLEQPYLFLKLCELNPEDGETVFRLDRKRGFRGNRLKQLGDTALALGGSDPENLSPKIANALALCSDLEVTVVAGAGYEKADELRKLKAGNLRVVFNPPSMVRLMKDSDQAVISAGGTLWELLSMGCAVLSYSRNTVQASVVQVLSHRGMVVDMGETCHFDPAKLLASVEGLVELHAARERMANLGCALVDGMGAVRIVEAMQTLGVQ